MAGRVRLHRVAVLAALASVLGTFGLACGSSSSRSVTAPSSDSRCNLTVGVDPRPLDPNGGTGTVTIAINRECAWTARSDVEWIALPPNASGQGNATLSFTVAGNPQVALRRGAIDVNSRRVEISQSAAPCAYALNALSRTVDATGDLYEVRVSAQAGCQWTATTAAPWMALAQASGNGAGSFEVAVARNPAEARTGAIAVAGLTHSVFQAAAQTPPSEPAPPPPPGCTYDLSASTQPVGADGGPGIVGVLASDGCPWTASSQVDWVVVTSPAAGAGSRDVRFTVSPNTSASPRIGSLSIAGRVLTITQAAAASPPAPPPPAPTPPPSPPPEPPPCAFTVAPRSFALEAAASTASVTVSATGASCAWTVTSSAAWLTASSLGGTGSGDVSFTAAANPDTSSRSATLTVAGQAIQVTQAGAPPPPPPPAPCTYSVSPASQPVPAAGGSGQIAVATSEPSCRWTAASDASWLTVTAGASGIGPGQVSFTASANVSTTARSAVVTIAGATATVTQEAVVPPPPPPPPPTCTFALSRTEYAVAAVNISEQLAVNTQAGCAWTAQSQVSWILITEGTSGTGPGTVRFTVALNAGLDRRTGTLLVAGQVVTVTQAGLLGARP